jgi:hypothetical protein
MTLNERNSPMSRALALLLNIFIAPLNTAFTSLGTMSYTNSTLNGVVVAAIDRAVVFYSMLAELCKHY